MRKRRSKIGRIRHKVENSIRFGELTTVPACKPANFLRILSGRGTAASFDGECSLKNGFQEASRWLARTIVPSLLVLGCGQSPSPQTSPHEESRSAATAGTQYPERYDLERDESLGGHTLARHVGRSDGQLTQRLNKERNISAASTWTSRDVAEETVGAALKEESGRIENWMRRGERRPNLALHYNAGRVIGRSLRRDSSESVPCSSAVIVLRANGPDSFYVLTTYPEARE